MGGGISMPESSANQRQIGGTHYRGGEYQHWDWAVENNLGYLEGQLTKYVSRWRKKNGAQDLEKALHYTDKLIEVVTARHGHTPLRNALPVVNLSLVTGTYELESDEIQIFRLVASYRDLEDLNILRVLIEKLLMED
jgi:Protein of unknwon function (DUF3310)